MENKSNRSGVMADLIPQFKYPDEAISAAEEGCISSRNNGNVIALTGWVNEWLDARDAVNNIDRDVFNAEQDVARVERELRAARERLRNEMLRRDRDRNTLLLVEQEKKSLLELARAAVRDAMTTGTRWRYSASGRVVSKDGKLDLARVEHVVICELRSPQ